MISRRDVLSGSLLAASALMGLRAGAVNRAAGQAQPIADIERQHGGRLGVAILDTTTQRLVTHRGNERFALCSTFKLLAAAFVLARVDRAQESLDRRVVYKEGDLAAYSPTTARHVRTGLTLRKICEAAVTLSDNTAANLLLDSFAGPSALTAYLRSLGDGVTRLDRREPELNDVQRGDPRDTTSPLAMLQLVQSILVGSALSPTSREQLIAWLVDSQTGAERLRAGVPAGWRVGDKTGSGPRKETNDVAIIWPPERAPILVAAYYADGRGSGAERNAVLAEVGRYAVAI